MPGERIVKSSHACVPPLPVGLGWRGLGSLGLASETCSPGCPWPPSVASWQDRGKREGGGRQCRMSEHWRQWASVAPRGRGNSSAASSLWFQEIRVPSDTIPQLGDIGSPQAPSRVASLGGVRAHRSSPLYLLLALRSVLSAVPHMSHQIGRTSWFHGDQGDSRDPVLW